MTTLAHKPRFIVDEEGRKTDVILSIEAYEELLKDLHDLAMVARVRNEERTPFEGLEEELKRSGKL